MIVSGGWKHKARRKETGTNGWNLRNMNIYGKFKERLAEETEDEELNAGCGQDINPKGANVKSSSKKTQT